MMTPTHSSSSPLLQSKLHRVLILIGIVSVSLLIWSSVRSFSQEAPASVPIDVMLAELKSAPSENDLRERMLHDLYLKAGADPRTIKLQDVTMNGQLTGHNVVVTKTGKSPAVIVIGGHLDKVDVGNGVIDDWSGCIVAKNLFRALRDFPTRYSFRFIGFTMEERGLVGSRQYVESLKAPGSPAVLAMVNFECIGVGGPFIWTNGSDDRLEAVAHRAARDANLELQDHTIFGVSADSQPFQSIGIPAITIDGLPRESFRLIHSSSDQYENVNPDKFHAAFKAGLEFVLALDRYGLDGWKTARASVAKSSKPIVWALLPIFTIH